MRSILHETIEAVQQRSAQLRSSIAKKRAEIEVLTSDLELADTILEQLRAMPAPHNTGGASTIPDLILEELRLDPSGCTLSQLETSIRSSRREATRDTIRTNAWRLVERGAVEKTADGRYRLRR